MLSTVSLVKTMAGGSAHSLGWAFSEKFAEGGYYSPGSAPGRPPPPTSCSFQNYLLLFRKQYGIAGYSRNPVNFQYLPSLFVKPLFSEQLTR